MRRVLKPGGTALVIDLRRDATKAEIEQEIAPMPLNAVNRWWTRMAFRHFLLKNAYTPAQFEQMARQAGFGSVELTRTLVGVEVWMRE